MQAMCNRRLHPNLPGRNQGSNPTTDNLCFFVIVSVDSFFLIRLAFLLYNPFIYGKLFVLFIHKVVGEGQIGRAHV